VVELKVGMHCERCVKVKKAIGTIDGNKPAINPVLSYTTKNRSLWALVLLTNDHACGRAHTDMESYHLETEINKATVTGKVTPEEAVSRALRKSYHSELLYTSAW
jgi:copper chaperone